MKNRRKCDVKRSHNGGVSPSWTGIVCVGCVCAIFIIGLIVEFM